MYLYGAKFGLMTDHKPLEFIFSPTSKTCARTEKWLLRMQPYRFTVKYRHCGFIVTSPVFSATVKRREGNRRICEVGSSRINACCLDNLWNWESIWTWSRAEKCTRLSFEWEMACYRIQAPVRGELSAIGKLVLRETTLALQIVVARHWQRGGRSL